ncbi:Structural polyprotein [Sleeping disease virus]|uniref:Structural polyprotein n=19 Tax=Alphavirus salmon subtype 1 TaxID=84589 RepID=POLS_SAV2|nr:Structural polyprotein [Sleeping disease virus]Q8QL52.1 RecName: Full=Structural polyprotein; AltName: Full=p130; Contains: RecName: Full=Capsid protein; AltName: Full=Coat protein; Short=C; Contains: RecName: Full=Precursor of protein E3/E2; AltName: Full=p62; AltName: Full=pE2; Contains: RecName: Full=Assembly protein E3; Contains: RecName: Full=Spike glycoprotein E2; AltName: Full=E2 envelope glycoprotein; Contains: RecName: Full=6K protein; Contains: RecName: Full=Spike glycoprotein E1; Alt
MFPMQFTNSAYRQMEPMFAPASRGQVQPYRPRTKRRQEPQVGNAAIAALANQMSALQLQVAGLAGQARVDRRGPRRVQKNKQKKKNSSNGEKPKEKKKKQKQQEKKGSGGEKAKKPRNRPGKEVRISVKRARQSTFPVYHDGAISGYAVLIGSRVFKPAHVKGKFDHPELADIKFQVAEVMDLEAAAYPKCMRDQAAEPATMMDGVYNGEYGNIQEWRTILYSMRAAEASRGDSGRPFTDNSGKVVGIVLGGGPDGRRTRLSVIGFDKKLKAREIAYSEAIPWTRAPALLLLPMVIACTYNSNTFDCSKPSCQDCCITAEPKKAMTMLKDNLNDPNYWDLLIAVTTCSSARKKRAVSTSPVAVYDTQILAAHAAASPYRAYCPDCDGTACISPIAIDEVVSSGSDHVLRIRVGSQSGVTAKGGAAGETSLRYLGRDGKVYAADNTRLVVRTTAKCDVLQATGHYILANCPVGQSLTVAATLDGTRHQCTTVFEHQVTEKFTRERSKGHHLSDLTKKCTRFSTTPKKSALYLVDVYDALPTSVEISTVVTCNERQCTVRVPPGTTVKFDKRCKNAAKETVTFTSDSQTFTCEEPVLTAASITQGKPHLRSSMLPSGGKEVKARIPFPFPPETATCRVSIAPLPSITYEESDVLLAGTAKYPVLLTTRNLGFHSNATSEWIQGKYLRRIPVTPQGIELMLGNNAPLHFWSSVRYASGDADAYPWELLVHHIKHHPEYAWAFVGVACGLLAVAACMFACACNRVRYSLLANTFNPNPPPLTALTAALCCIPGARADQPYLDIIAYLWTNSKVAFGLQCAAPVACMLIVTYALRHCRLCCNSFLGVRGWSALLVILAYVQSCKAYEHTVVVPMDPRAPSYEAVINRNGYDPLKLTIAVNFTVISPTTALEYWTCAGVPVVEPPHVGCCTSVSCPSDLSTLHAFTGKAVSDVHCDVHTNVYPLLWGAAHCFCSTENTQVSAVAATVSEFCAQDSERAEAFSVHSSSVTAEILVTLGEVVTAVHVYVDGVTSARGTDLKIVAGPITTDYSPFDRKVVRIGEEVYNYDWPPYGAGRPGTFGDIQARSTNYVKPNDLYGDIGIEVLQPTNDHVHVAYTYTTSGLLRWLQDAPKPLSVTAPHGCKISANPLLALDCGVGAVPMSINIPDAKFTRKLKDPKPSALKCVVDSCEYGVDYGGAATITYEGHEAGKCGIHSLTPGVPLRTSVVEVVAGANTVKTTFSSPTPEVTLEVEICSAIVKCASECTPPKEHVVAARPRHGSDTGGYISGPAMRWAGRIVGNPSGPVSSSLAVTYCVVKKCRSKRIRIVKS